ncbi:RDD family protein [Trinickia acidisoli]|uniref:RDD family protein n=1 Tax=Trinickia acidisoli TaxID=2767482 RepID=UPI001A8D686C|nr:RDD family protein [Trinickia acidisoli]
METPNNETAGFWRRTAAFAIDSLVLGLIGMALAILFFDVLSMIGEWGRIIGFLIGAAYFTLLEGDFGGRSQSLGKQVMRIKVMRCQAGELTRLSARQACLRYVIIAVPLVLHGIGFVDTPALQMPSMQWLTVTNGILISLWGAALFYLLAFNRPSRRSLHDLATSSVVVRETATYAVAPPPAKKHYVIMVALGALMMVTGAIANRWVASRLTNLYEVQRAVSSVPGVGQAGISTTSVRQLGSSRQSVRRIVAISVVVRNPALSPDRCFDAVGTAAFSASPDLAKHDLVTIVCARSVDLGIASWRWQAVDARTPSQWLAKLKINPAAPHS